MRRRRGDCDTGTGWARVRGDHLADDERPDRQRRLRGRQRRAVRSGLRRGHRCRRALDGDGTALVGQQADIVVAGRLVGLALRGGVQAHERVRTRIARAEVHGLRDVPRFAGRQVHEHRVEVVVARGVAGVRRGHVGVAVYLRPQLGRLGLGGAVRQRVLEAAPAVRGPLGAGLDVAEGDRQRRKAQVFPQHAVGRQVEGRGIAVAVVVRACQQLVAPGRNAGRGHAERAVGSGFREAGEAGAEAVAVLHALIQDDVRRAVERERCLGVDVGDDAADIGLRRARRYEAERAQQRARRGKMHWGRTP